MDDFVWNVFYDRFVINYEELMFYYNGKELHISTGGYGGKAYIAYGNKEMGYVTKEYASPLALLKDKQDFLGGKNLREAWDYLS